MKRFTYLIVAFTIAATSSQVFGQTDGGNDGNVQLPAVQQARDAFYASVIAYQLAQNQAAIDGWEWQAQYWQISANYQYQSMVRLYTVWTSLEEHGILLPAIGQLLGEAETYSWYAAWYAGNPPFNYHPVVDAADEAYEKAYRFAIDFGW